MSKNKRKFQLAFWGLWKGSNVIRLILKFLFIITGRITGNGAGSNLEKLKKKLFPAKSKPNLKRNWKMKGTIFRNLKAIFKNLHTRPWRWLVGLTLGFSIFFLPSFFFECHHLEMRGERFLSAFLFSHCRTPRGKVPFLFWKWIPFFVGKSRSDFELFPVQFCLAIELLSSPSLWSSAFKIEREYEHSLCFCFTGFYWILPSSYWVLLGFT